MSTKDFLFLQYGKSLLEALRTNAIHVTSLNSYEHTAAKYYESIIGPYPQGAVSWDELQKEEIKKASLKSEPLSDVVKAIWKDPK